MSSLPKSQQSIASGLFQTLTRLSLTIGMAATTAIFDAVSKSPDKGFHAGDPIRPYSGAFWFATGCAGFSLLFVPFLTIKTQGGTSKTAVDDGNVEVVQMPSAGSPGPTVADEFSGRKGLH